MSKLPPAYKFVDLSDYGRPIARQIAISLKNTSCTPVQVTWLFIISGLIAIAGIFFGYFYLAAFLIWHPLSPFNFLYTASKKFIHETIHTTRQLQETRKYKKKLSSANNPKK